MINLSKLEKGKKKENEVESFLKNKGWKVKRNTFYDNEGNEIAQFVVIGEFPKSYPDFTVEKYKDKVCIKYLVEVKSMERYSLDGEPSVTIPCYQFLSYKDIQENEEIPVYVIFVLYRNAFDEEAWFSQTLNKLDKSKRYIENAYKDEDKHCAWNLDSLKEMK